MLRLAPKDAPVIRVAWQARAFTLVELMVVLVIISILASLTLAGLGGVRQRAKADKTRSTIRKIDSVIQPMYESYATRRVRANGLNRTSLAQDRLRNVRVLMTVEMPDMWGDVGFAFSAGPPSFTWAQNAIYRRYARYKTALNTVTPLSDPKFAMYESAETLMMILSMGGFEPGCMESFRGDEIGDIDGDSAKEFWDGWGRPILFLRWPASFASPLVNHSQPDPLDFMKVTGPPVDWAMSPLILSAGPDEATNDPLGTISGYGIQYRPQPPATPTWLTSLTATIPPMPSTCTGNINGAIADPVAASDNITNYDLLKK
jgi:prepilin-type N-terminal cleavage/methylation domain-containing protein